MIYLPFIPAVVLVRNKKDRAHQGPVSLIFAIGALSARQIRRGALSVHAHHHVVDADIVYKHGGSSFPEMSDKANYITTVHFVKLKPLQITCVKSLYQHIYEDNPSSGQFFSVVSKNCSFVCQFGVKCLNIGGC